jgi:hypothetical protein
MIAAVAFAAKSAPLDVSPPLDGRFGPGWSFGRGSVDWKSRSNEPAGE